MVTAQLTPVGVGIQNVLIATDFSNFSNAALNYGLRLARSYEATAYVVFVVPADEFLIAGPEAYVAAKDAAARDLDELKAELQRKHSYVAGRDYHLCLLEGDVAQTVLDFARNKHIDLIVLGTHGRGGLGKALMGSVAEKVFRQSSVPVLTLGPHLRRSAREHSPRNLVVAADLTSASARAAHFAATLARESHAKLTLLHVVDAKNFEHLPDKAAAKRAVELRLEELAGRPCEGLEVAVRVAAGKVVPTILHALDEVDADLLVIGVHPSRGLLDRVMFPHAYELVCESPCPVLTLRESPRHANVN